MLAVAVQVPAAVPELEAGAEAATVRAKQAANATDLMRMTNPLVSARMNENESRR
jgi:hypothetical protein